MKNFLSSLVLSLFCTIAFAQLEPTVPPNNLSFNLINQDSLSISWTRGNGEYCLVVVRPSANTHVYPADGANYSANVNYGSGSHLGSGNYVVYEGTGSSVIIRGLAANTLYSVYIYEFNTQVFPFLDTYYLQSPNEAGSHYTTTSQPLTQVSGLTASALTDDMVTLNWTSGTGTYDLATVRVGTSNTSLPADGFTYSGSSAYGSGAVVGTAYAVYNSSGTSVNVSNLSPATNYVANATTYNLGTGYGSENYLLNNYPVVGFTTLAAEPSGICNSLYVTDVTDNAMTIHWIRPTVGAGANVIVTVRQGTTADSPVDGSNYTANSVFGSGSLIGSSRVVYIGPSNTIRVTGLIANTVYYAKVVEFNGGSGWFNYTNNYSGSSLNGSQYTLNPEPASTSSALIFSNIQKNQVTATWTNGSGPYRTVAVRPGRIQTALAFDGTDDYVGIPYNAALHPTSEVTLECWAYKASWSGAQLGTLCGNTENGGFAIAFAGSGSLLNGWVKRNGSYATPQTDVGYLVPGWHHFALTFDGRYTRLIVDGAEKAMNDAGGVYSIDYTYNNSFFIGAEGSTGATPQAGGYFNGYIDEVRVKDIALSASSIRNTMHKSSEGDGLDLIAEWKMNDGYTAGTAVKNNSLNGTALNGAMSGMPSTAAGPLFTGTSGWIRSAARVDMPVDFSYYSPNSIFQNGVAIGQDYYSVYWGNTNSVTVTGLSPNTYYDFYVVEDNYTAVSPYTHNHLVSTYAMEDVLTSPQLVPTITSFSPAYGPVGTVVTINGTNFDATAANNQVYFGTELAQVVSASANQLKVVAPYCTNNLPISVTVNTLSAYSKSPFIISTTCPVTFDAGSLTSSSIAGSASKFDIAAGDLNGDGKTDMISAEYASSGNLVISKNTSSNGFISWAAGTSLSVTWPWRVRVADFDGDRKLDPVSINYSDAHLNFFRNKSTASTWNFAAKQNFPLLSSPYTLAVSDLDKDGKPDVIVGYSSQNFVSVYRNTSSMGFISFANRVDVATPYTTQQIASADMDGDGKEDIVIAPGSAGTTVDLLRNTSAPGTISFAAAVSRSLGTSGPVSIALADLNEDDKIDVAVGLYNVDSIRIYRNLNTSGSITAANFTMMTRLSTYTTASTYPASIAIYDIDGGTGDNDIVVGYNNTANVSVFKQTGSFAFASRVDFTAPGGTSALSLALADYNLDGKNDVAASSGSATVNFYTNTTLPLDNEPTLKGTLTFSGLSQYSVTVNFSGGNGTSRILVGKKGSPVDVLPKDGTSYTASAAFGNAPSDMGGGNFVLYDGSGTTVNVTNLESSALYYYAVFEYKGTSCQKNYLTSNYVTNSNTQYNTPPTLNSISSPSAVCQSPGTQTVSLAGIGTGIGYEVQPLSVTATSSNQTLLPNGNISVPYVSPNATVNLTYTPAAVQSGTVVITVTVNDGASNNDLTSKTFTVIVTPSPTVANAGTNTTICNTFGNITGNTPAIGTGTWTIVYQTGGSSIALVGAGSPAAQAINFLVNDSARLAWTISNPPCAPSVSYVSMVRKSCPLTADFSASPTAFCGTSATVNYTDESTAGGSNSIVQWEWTFPGGTPATYSTTIAPGNPPAIAYSASGSYNAELKVTDNGGGPGVDTELKTAYIDVTPFPGTASTINATTSAPCEGSPTQVVYTVAPITNANYYNWTVPPGAINNSGQGNTSINVTYPAGAVSGSVTVNGQNDCGTGSTYSLAVTVIPLPGSSTTINGPVSVCPNQTGVIFTTPVIAGASTYSWTLPSGGSITSGPGTNSVTVSFSGATSGNVDVVGINSCSLPGTSSASYFLNVDPLPDPAGAINGFATVCQNDTVVYDIALLGNTNTYTWTVPSGAVILSGNGTNIITVKYPPGSSSGNVSVYGVNACGNGTSSLLAVTVNPLPDNATAIVGALTLCAGTSNQNYSVSGITNATSYTWSVPTGFTISGTATSNSIYVDLANDAVTGVISVHGTNDCGDGSASSFTVTVSPKPDHAGTIGGNATVCQGQNSVIYSVSAIQYATGYSWTVPPGASIVSGANTDMITVDFSNSASSGSITVVGTNACLNGLSADTFVVTVDPLPDPSGIITGDVTITICPVQTGITYSITPVNNAAAYMWTVPSGAVIASGSNTNVIVVNYSDTAVSGNITVTPANACGNGVASNLTVDVDTVQSQSICIVTVDSTSTKNFLIWEKPASTSIDSFFVYRENTGIYTKIGAVDYNAVSEFTDNTNGVNPKTSAYKYKVSSVDACGNESYLSEYHRTIHLQVSPASPFGYNLNWNDYEGFPVTKYRIMRDTLGTGVYHAADSTGFGTITWTDIKNYQITDTIGYYIEITYPGGGSCISSLKNPDLMGANLNYSKSNINKIADTTLTGIIGINDNYLVSVYPNPSIGLFTLDMKQLTGSGELSVFNMLGETVMALQVSDKDEKLRVNMNGYSKGVYQVQVKRGNSIVNKKVILQ